MRDNIYNPPELCNTPTITRLSLPTIIKTHGGNSPFYYLNALVLLGVFYGLKKIWVQFTPLTPLMREICIETLPQFKAVLENLKKTIGHYRTIHK